MAGLKSMVIPYFNPDDVNDISEDERLLDKMLKDRGHKMMTEYETLTLLLEMVAKVFPDMTFEDHFIDDPEPKNP